MHMAGSVMAPAPGSWGSGSSTCGSASGSGSGSDSDSDSRVDPGFDRAAAEAGTAKREGLRPAAGEAAGVDPLIGRATANGELVLARSVWRRGSVERQGLVLDRQALIAWLEQRVLAETGLGDRARLAFGAQAEVPSRQAEHRYLHRFAVERRARADVVADVRNRDAQAPAVTCALRVHRVVEVARVRAVDGDQRDLAQIFASLLVAAAYAFTEGFGFGQDFVGKLVRDAE